MTEAPLPDDVDARVDALYGLALDRFVPERDALARELRGGGRRAEAAAVAKLPKPSIAAWATNQVVRTQAADARALWKAGDEVVAVQERVLAGTAPGGDLREAVTREREALGPLTAAARGLMTGAGRFLGEPAVQEVIESLHAAAVDPAVRTAVAGGRLARPVRLAGLGALAARPEDASPGAATPAAPSREPAGRDAPEVAPRPRRETTDRRREREQARRIAEAERAADAAGREHEAAAKRARQAERRRDTAARRVEAARRAVEAAEGTLEDAEQELAAARDAAREAAARADEARGAVERARDA